MLWLIGASSGVGRDLVLSLARDGFHVYAGVRKTADLEDLLALKVPGLAPVILDVTVQEHIDALHERIQRDGIKLVALINSAGATTTTNNKIRCDFCWSLGLRQAHWACECVVVMVCAGISGSAPLELLQLEKFDQTFTANVRGPVMMMQKFLPMLRENKGRIVNVSSITTSLCFAGSGAYSPSKCALEALTDQLRREMFMEGYEVAVVTVQPGTIKTPIWDKAVQGRAACDPDQLLKLYPKVASWARALIAASQKSGELPEHSTTPVIKEALMSPYPKTRYQCSTISKVIPAAVVMWFAWLMPDRLMDLFLSRKP